MTGQAREAWAFEAAPAGARRPARVGDRQPHRCCSRWSKRRWWPPSASVSPRALAFFLGQALLAIALLEAFNYIAHYGLTRRRLPNGRLEPLGPMHSWNTRRRMNNRALFNMGRHADHHRFSTRPYHELEVLDGGAMLPCGYAGVLLMALIPPLWRRVMDPRVDAALDDPQAIGRMERAAA